MKRCLSTLCTLLALAAPPVLAGKPDGWTMGELTLAPAFCPDTMGFKYGDQYSNTSPQAARWVAMMGPGFWAMHHFCWADINIRRAQTIAMPRSNRIALLESGISDYNYVLINTSPSFVMRPEIFLRIGDTQVLLGRKPHALQAYAAARDAKPDYWPAYQREAQILIDANLHAKAKELVRQGLARAPEAKPLQQLYVRLGGQLADVAPPAPAAPPASSASAAAAASAAATASAPAAPASAAASSSTKP